ncbi:MAG: beta-xylosidase [Rhizobiales bacterium]|uniref:family 43 glycosylhydrolase n=1 Tax=unclassified Leeuwenhoekiella TaxID=2615029 RepID=UPI000C5750DD|nr:MULTISPECIES: family 43 glycosylhydrolase [unclassified Leeuwenhoekiella]MAW94218.1 beta-xylosidase [Leeuwenhoekiella sp.]MAW96868.1 beta-xylosidase [Leeuwenhoekiella sp.]MBA67592.1 beta-xylosidase [Hyphomicrobiales bacterium]|tara:strand:- start:5291 stop:6868 length:1578 start_codon:yes stop_codon:yes gene_type:complete
MRFLIFLTVLSSILFQSACAQNQTITNDSFWETVDGTPIYAQGGGIFRFEDPQSGKPKYFWYGVHYAEAETYRDDPSVTLERNHFKGVTCYTSTDLVNWTFEKHVLTPEAVDYEERPTWLGRMGVAYLAEIDQYALFIQHGKNVMIALADSALGDFKVHRHIDMTERIGTPNTGDQTVFTDQDTGKSYLVYSYGQGRNKIYISEIGVRDGQVDLLDLTEIFRGASREGNCMFKYKGRYYMAASNIYGWDGSFAYYLVADDIRGPYRPLNDMQIIPGSEQDYAHVSQTGFFYTVNGSENETVLFCGDRWAEFAGNGLGYNQWVPLSFVGEVPYFNSLHAWNLDEQTGNWTVATTNNYVKNGSFESDRRHIPSNNKPVQEQLLGWHTQIIKGNTISTTNSSSPVLNYFNTREDRKKVVGEKSLNISDDIPFERRIIQDIVSTVFVVLPDGNYTLSAKIKNTPGFKQLLFYANSGGQTFEIALDAEHPEWIPVTLESVKVRHGKVTIGIYAKGQAGASAQIDDIRLEM